MVMRPMVCAPMMAAVSRAEKLNWSRKKSRVASPFPSGLGWVSARSVLNCSCSPSYSDTQSARPDWNWISRGRTTWPQHTSGEIVHQHPVSTSQSSSPLFLMQSLMLFDSAIKDPKLLFLFIQLSGSPAHW